MSELEAIGEEIWLADGGIVDFYGFPYPTRMTCPSVNTAGKRPPDPVAT